jgi:hypothetical protein
MKSCSRVDLAQIETLGSGLSLGSNAVGLQEASLLKRRLVRAVLPLTFLASNRDTPRSDTVPRWRNW